MVFCMKRILCFGMLVALVSCGPPESVHPVTTAASAKLDPALLGHWEGHEEEKKTHSSERLLLDVSVKEGGTMWLVLPPDRKGEREMRFEGHLSKLGKLTVLNVRQVNDDDDGFGQWMFLRYLRGPGDTFKLAMLREDPVFQAIRAGTLKGRITGSPESAVILDTPEKIARFLQSAKPEELFESMAVFKRRSP